jgi:hypothetical protein
VRVAGGRRAAQRRWAASRRNTSTSPDGSVSAKGLLLAIGDLERSEVEAQARRAEPDRGAHAALVLELHRVAPWLRQDELP